MNFFKLISPVVSSYLDSKVITFLELSQNNLTKQRYLTTCVKILSLNYQRNLLKCVVL